MNPTKALYVDWSMPRKFRGSRSLSKKPWEIALIIRTTYFSKEVNGLSPVLYCDPEIYEYYKNIGLDSCFDEVHPILPTNPNFNPSVFWSAGKFLAIREMSEPFLMIDLDAEVRFPIDFSDCDVFCAHAEEINDNDLIYYPHPTYLGKNYMVDKYGPTWNNLAYNTCLLYFKDLEVAKRYAEEALKFIETIPSIDPAFESGYILLAEQRFLHRMCEEENLKVRTLISGVYKTEDPLRKLPSHFEDSDVEDIGKMGFLHVWGFKNKLNSREESEHELFGNLISSRLNLKDKIVECVKNSRILYSGETIIS